MLKFIFVMFFFFLLLLFLLGFSVLRTFKNILFGKSSTGKTGQQRQTTSSSRQETSSRTHQSTAASRKKIIGDDEGEYVDYEEVK